MALIKNAVVKMDWEADSFYESKANGTFVSALNMYEDTMGDDLPIIFKDGKAFILWDPETEKPLGVDEYTQLLAKLTRKYGENVNLEEVGETADMYVEICNGISVDPDIAEAYCIDEEVSKDIVERVHDLRGYFSVEYQDFE